MLARHQLGLHVLPPTVYAHAEQAYEGGAVIEPILQMSTLRARESDLEGSCWYVAELSRPLSECRLITRK